MIHVEKVVETDWSQITILRRVTCRISKATRAQAYARARAPTHRCMQAHALIRARARARTHTCKYVILNALAGQEWFRKRASVLRYTFTDSPVVFRWFKYKNQQAKRLLDSKTNVIEALISTCTEYLKAPKQSGFHKHIEALLRGKKLKLLK